MTTPSISDLDVEPLVLHASKRQAILLLLIWIVGAVGSVYEVLNGQMVGWLLGAAECVTLPFLVLRLITNASRLIVTADGFSVTTPGWRCSYPWIDVDHFRVGSLQTNEFFSQKAVVFTLSKSHTKQTVGRALTWLIAEADGVLPESYGMDHQALADLMNEVRRLRSS